MERDTKVDMCPLTVQVPKDLRKAIRISCVERELTMSELVVEALQIGLALSNTLDSLSLFAASEGVEVHEAVYRLVDSGLDKS